MTLSTLLLLLLAGFACGFINTLAGNGSAISLAVMIFLGLPANIANGTNRVAILLQSLTALYVFKRHNELPVGGSRIPLIASLAGSFAGAFIATRIPAPRLETLFGIMMLLMLALILFKPRAWTAKGPGHKALGPGLQIPLFFAIGLYGGMIQAGVGIFLLSALVLASGLDLVKANAIKILIVAVYTPLALAIFIIHGQVDWTWGLVLTAGNIGGAWLASILAIKHGPRYIRWILIPVMAWSAFELLR